MSSNPRIGDASARASALRTDQSFIVQAPAGSGKTGLLVYRMLKLLARVDKPEQVLAITFTRKATSEMRHRILQLLTKAEAGSAGSDRFEQQGIDLARQVLERSRCKHWELLDVPQQLQILTIDAFCAKLAGDMPWLSRLGDKPRTTDQAEAHYAAAIEQLFEQLLAAPSPLSSSLQTVMLELDFDYNKVRRLFTVMLGKRDQWLRHLLRNDIRQLRPSLETAWREICEEHLTLLRDLFTPQALHQLVGIAVKAASFHNVENSPLGIFSGEIDAQSLSLDHWRGLQFILLTQGREQDFRKQLDIRCGFPPNERELKKQAQELIDNLRADTELLEVLQQVSTLPEQQFSDDDWQQIVALEEVLKALAAFLQLRFRAVGECDHSEVAQRANLALQELSAPTDLALRIDYQLQHILVDEFQDTSHSQLELLKKLTAGWQAADTGSSQTLFLVGDPMQSIYRFREADVSLFLQVVDNRHTAVFDNIDLEFLQLSENFRSATSLVDWFNATFSASFPRRNKVLTGAITYAAATSNRPEPGSVKCLLGETREKEAQLVVRAIQETSTRLSDEQAQVAVLVRSRSHLKYILPHIQKAGIAYAGVDLQPLGETPAVKDVVALGKAICRLDDRISWLSLLRSPWCGLSLHEITQLAPRQNIPVWHQLQTTDAGTVCSQQSLSRLARFSKIMQQALAQRQQVALHSLVRWAWTALGGEQTLLNGQVEDVQAVFTLIEEFESGGDLPSVLDLDKALDKLYAQPASSKRPRVVISTMHKAKGLQFHTVILPGLGSQSQTDEKNLLMWAEHTNYLGAERLLLAPVRLKQQEGSHFDYLRALEKQRSSNEMIRLMYVACTRAESQVILTGCAKQDADTLALKTPSSSSLLATVWAVVADCFEFHAADDSLAEQQDPAVLSQELLRLPGDFSVSYAPVVSWQAPPPLSSLESLPANAAVDQEIEYQWATEVAAAVGVVMHNWLQFNSGTLFTTALDDALFMQWRAELAVLGVAAERQQWAIDRLTQTLQVMQEDSQARFIFKPHKQQRNEFMLSTIENGRISSYRLDRTFVDEQGTRWIVDYKTTSTHRQDIDKFIDQQVAQRHRPQLEKYGKLMHELDPRPIKLAVYFPVLGKLRCWDFKTTN